MPGRKFQYLLFSRDVVRKKGIAGCRVVTTNSKTCEICLWERNSEIDLVSRMTFMDIY